MTDFIVVAHPKHDRTVWEPVHPGHTTEADAKRLSARMHDTGIDSQVWTADQWEDYQTEQQADLFCDFCGAMKEDCSGHEEES